MARAVHVLMLVLMLGCAGARPTLDERISSSGLVAKKADTLLEQANRQVLAEALDRADASVAEARSLLANPDMVYYLDREVLRERLEQTEARLAAARDVQRKRALELRLAERKQQVQKAAEELQVAINALANRDELARKPIKRARNAVEATNDQLREGEKLEGEDTAYATWTQQVRKQIAQGLERIAVAEKLMDFVEGPVALEAIARALVEKANGEAKGVPEERKKHLLAAREKYLACAATGASLLASPPDVSREPLANKTAKTSPKAFTAACEAQAKAIDQTLNPQTLKPTPTPGPKKRPAPSKKKSK